MDITQLMRGDAITRLLGGRIPIPMRVVRVEDDVLYCKRRDDSDETANRHNLVWTFDRVTGWEIDEDLGWGPRYGFTGSILVADDDPRAQDRASTSTEHATDVTQPRVIELRKPVDGLVEQYERDRALFADEIAEAVLGPAGRMIALSKNDYAERHPSHVVVFNANLCTTGRGKIWFGDLDLTQDEPLLVDLAVALGETVFVLYERDARFGTEMTPQLHAHVAKVSSKGLVPARRWIVRDSDGRLRIAR
jgi:hypothetical protein